MNTRAEHDKHVFDREATLLVEFFHGQPEDYHDPDYNMSMEDWAHKLADDFGIGYAEIWDLFPNYER